MKSFDEYRRDFEAHFEFITEFAWAEYRRSGGGLSLREILEKRTLLGYILRTTVEDAGKMPTPGQKLLDEAESCAPASEKEWRAFMASHLPGLREHAFAQYPGILGPNPLFPPGCSVRFDPPRDDVPEGWCVLHFHNALAPGDSFLQNRPHMIASLERAVEESRIYNFTTFYTMTWLNELPRFLSFFPDEWTRNRGEPYEFIAPNLGFLGQLLTKSGGLNRSVAAELLASGRLPFRPRKAHCSRNALEKLLARQ